MLHYNKGGEPCGLISNIAHYTIHDGPGIRTAVYFMGCTMRCIWCSNPETFYPQQQIGIYPSRCISLKKCGYCIKACPQEKKPISFDKKSVLSSLEMIEECEDCFICADACPTEAIKLWGKKMTIAELMKVIERDRKFYDRSGGGVTLNGGEVMLQWEFARKLLMTCKTSGINTCVETALNCPKEDMEAVYEYTDLVIADIKNMDSQAHEKYTGYSNEIILSNLITTVELEKKLVIRTPVVPGLSGDEQDLRAIAEFIKNKLYGRILRWQLLPFHKLGTEKYEALNIPYPMSDYIMPERKKTGKELVRLAEILKAEYSIPIEVTSEETQPIEIA